jgi:hypothetical protein
LESDDVKSKLSGFQVQFWRGKTETVKILKLYIPILMVFLIITITCTIQPASSQTRLMDNGIIRIGIDLNSGGAISYLVEMGSFDSAVNVYDLGRYIQQSYYSGPTPFIPPGAIQHPSYANWSWNPVQAGDVYHNRSEVVAESNDGTTLYVKCIPKQWALLTVGGFHGTPGFGGPTSSSTGYIAPPAH